MHPLVIVTQDGYRHTTDLATAMLSQRIVLLDTGIEDSTASDICSQLLFLEAQQPGEQIQLYINSPGGIVSAGLAIYDTMQLITSPVQTLVMGQAASMAAVLLCSGTGGRFALPHSRIMVHQPSGGFKGQVSDAEIHTQEMLRLKDTLNQIIARHSRLPLDQVKAMTDRDCFLSPNEARQLGLVDKVLSPPAP